MTTTENEDLILADAIPDPEVSSDYPCDIDGCGKLAETNFGVGGEIELCSDHAATLVLQALGNADILEALAKRGESVLVLDAIAVNFLRALIYSAEHGRISSVYTGSVGWTGPPNA